MVKEKLIKRRNEKAFTQKDLAEYLSISQTQYSRKEKGEVEISDEEWERISRLLDTNVEEIKETDENKSITNYFENTITSNNGSISGNYYCNVPEFLLENQKEFIEMLKREIHQKDTEIETIKKRIEELEK
ncbi:helix-turn-helix transcriptional regulator [Chryseobacterium sp. RP-3-3]|uniref:Helix-turn-helix transcriptional regulator n=1 Tax=Chryseobacterium antibioticum TaxID=2728847 RepID=A0A7Y0ARF9_9FLAO|nr:helix-turn-helix transcriptional regulator [Chryseobacterium antibioticum]NML72141.1 helix-turn-helix transcriptional regulator [Chryseobacterium antibioticum]